MDSRIKTIKEGELGTRPSWDEYFMHIAIGLASRASCHHVHSGTVIVSENHIIAASYNGAPSRIKDNCLKTGCRKELRGLKYEESLGSGECIGVHSEMNALGHLTKMNSKKISVYTTIFPCKTCAKNLLAYDLDKIIFKKIYSEKEMRQTLELLEEAGVNVLQLNLSKERDMDIRYSNQIKFSAWADEPQKIDKFEKEIMVVNIKKLFNETYFNGFLHHSEKDFHSRVLNNFEWMKRGLAEKNPEFKQPIAYCIIVNPELKKVFVYQRSTKAGESRLHNLFTIGIGGHIDTPDYNEDESKNENPIHKSMFREINEEIQIPEQSEIEPIVLGYINDDSNDVGKVHLGILYLIKTNAEEVYPKDSEIAEGKFIHFNELKDIFSKNEVETWSKIAFEPLKKFFEDADN